MRILVVRACGLVGDYVVSRFVADGRDAGDALATIAGHPPFDGSGSA